jgi:hypothetical protein
MILLNTSSSQELTAMVFSGSDIPGESKTHCLRITVEAENQACVGWCADTSNIVWQQRYLV